MLFGNKHFQPSRFDADKKKMDIRDIQQIFHPFACTATGVKTGERVKPEEREEFIEYLGQR